MRKRSLLTNSTIVVFAQIWGMLLALGITPYVYRSLGSERYGLFALVLVLANYLTVVDFGFGWGTIKFVAEYAAQSDLVKMQGVVRVAIWLSLAMGIVLAVVLACLAPWLSSSVFSVPQDQIGIVSMGVMMAGGVAILILESNVLAGVLKGLQRFDYAISLQSFFTTIRMVGYVLLLKTGHGLLSMWILTIATMLLCALAYRACIKRLVPEISLWPRLDRTSFRTLFSFSVFGFGTRLLTMPYFYLDKLFIGSLLPMAALAYYVIPFNLAHKLGGIGSLAVSVLFPSASERAHDPQKIQELYRRTVPIAYGVIVPMVLVAVTMGPSFLHYWIDEDFAVQAGLPLILIAIGFGAAALGSVDGMFLEGVGKPKVRTAIYFVLALVSLPLCYVLTRRFGIAGTAVTVGSAFFVGGVLEVLFHQVLVAKSWWYARRIFTSTGLLTALGLTAGWAIRPLVAGPWGTMGASVALYIVLLVIGMGVFQTHRQFRAQLTRLGISGWRMFRKIRFETTSLDNRTT